ncbi:methyl-accepting chemotaxis protein [Rhodoferax sp.]|uniref:methyl-accepting chemotaxis protein n=1 Tax=Rhodoferax sp. TaxID=50421 RepID=UPI0027186A24|nr:methyl-accepting chemotaxis protein [Rhodoferax sp.]MDO9198255.1 methyl-accepting chemotaxis protein [Rhodoferax sp.]
MKISTRLMLLGGTMSALVIVIAGLGLFGMGTSSAALRSVYEDRTVPVGQMGDIEAMILENRLAIAVALATPTPAVIATSATTVDANIVAISKTWTALMATKLTVDEEKLAKAFAEDRRRFVQEGLQPTVAALRANDIAGAQRLVAEKVEPLYVPVHKGIRSLIQIELDGAKKAFTDAETRDGTIRWLSIAIFVVGMLASGLYNFLLIRSIRRQLGAEPAEAAEVAKTVGAGDLTMRINLMQGDGTSLMAQLKAMQESLTKVVTRVRQGSQSVETASAEIAQGNNDLSARTEQQASALEETAASMEQLSATVKQNADSARQANQLAMGASTVAIKGGEVVSQVVDTMKGINESSRKISDIISVIDGIAFQTNILALNAAVEAARAGEQGRGFAVVATEVRSLAGRSAEAAREIKSLINASVERVEQGTALVDQAGTTMAEVVSSIRRVTDIMGEISSASSEQALGVAQVGEAVTHMDQATQQNAALVEQMAAAASSLKSQAEELVEVVAVFTLPGSQNGLTTSRAPTTRLAPARKPAPSVAINQKKPAIRTPARQTALNAPAPATKATAATDDGWDTF